jgi:hypothetical protein
MSLLTVPLIQAQVDAAHRLQSHLRQWRMTDRALIALATGFPRWEPEATLLKVVAINQLYGTNLYAVNRMAEHVATVMATAEPAIEGPALVERIATLPKSAEQKTQRRHFSFASKLANFFIDAEHFPIYDYYAAWMVVWHLGPAGHIRDGAHPYLAFVASLERLGERSGLTWAGRALDHYLWLAGQYHAWKRNPKTPINAEVARLFAQPLTKQDAADLAVLQATR